MKESGEGFFTLPLEYSTMNHVLAVCLQCMDFGYHNSVGRAMMMYLSVHEHLRNEHQKFVESLNKCITDLDSRADKQKFMELNNQVFMLPKKFEFQPFKGDEVGRCGKKLVWVCVARC